MTRTSVPTGLSTSTALRRQKYSSRAFFLTILVVTTVAVFSLIPDRFGNGRRAGAAHNGVLQRRLLQRRQLEEETNLECHLVHHAEDKCAFVLANCPDEEAGLFSYLSLYYCRLPHAQPVAFTVMVLWLALLFSTIGIAASDFFCINLSTISNILGMSESMAGVTFLAFGNGSPDVFSTFAAMSTNSGSLAVGELIGAAGFITAVVAGSMALVRPFKVAKKSFVRDVSFFAVAACFSLGFLYDGKLYMWECAAMVAFYIFYVVFVLVWHWWLGRRRKRREKDAIARANFVSPGGEEVDTLAEYHDDEDADAGGRPTPRRGVSADDISALERGFMSGLDNEDEEDSHERWLSELRSNMRLSKPRLGERRATSQNPIRPSLVGALEFQAVLSGLQKSRNIQSIPIHLRRYSDDPMFTTAHQQDQLSTNSDPASRPPYQIIAKPGEGDPELRTNKLHQDLWTDARDGTGNRLRAVSAGDADALRLDPSALKKNGVPKVDLLAPLPEHSPQQRPSAMTLQIPGEGSSHGPPSPGSRSPTSAHVSSRAASPKPHARAGTPDFLAPPESGFPFGRDSGSGPVSPGTLSPKDASQIPSNEGPTRPGIKIPQTHSSRRSSTTSPFPVFDHLHSPSPSRTPSIRLPPPSASIDSSFYPNEHFVDEEQPNPLKWWPYKVMPPPEMLVSTLFPTLYNWAEKNWWQRCLGVVSAPSVFLLTATLPVVETEKDEEDDDTTIPDFSLPGSFSSAEGGHTSQRRSTVTILEPEANSTDERGVSGRNFSIASAYSKGLGAHGTSATVAAQHENVHEHAYHDQPVHNHQQAPSSQAPTMISPRNRTISQSPEQLPTISPCASTAKDWNRWLVILQAFTAPFFIVLIIWANTEADNPHALVRPVLIGLLASLLTLAFILGTTTPSQPPKWRILLCFLGFAVSIAWISSIANEVVGVLKTLGVILNISDAILGLTIFAVGNSLGDLVADITVARLGFPVMALSACFGGPMLNILLGIGVSGMYITLKGARKHQAKHPDRPVLFKPYPVEVSSTLLISGATLLITLLGLLIAVPLRKWKMDKVIGWGLVALWCVSTIGNVVAEVLGLGGPIVVQT